MVETKAVSMDLVIASSIWEDISVCGLTAWGVVISNESYPHFFNFNFFNSSEENHELKILVFLENKIEEKEKLIKNQKNKKLNIQIEMTHYFLNFVFIGFQFF
jgi:hypothetical protein